DEPDILDYDTSFKPDEQDAIYEPNAYRSSDHDPVLIGLDLLNFEFDGFQDPIDERPALNVVKAGAAIPIKFELSGDLGLGILFGTPTTTEFDCTTGESLGAAGTEFAGGSGLQYDPLTNTYTYVWKTEKDWAGDCRTFRVTFDDGTYWEADFHFTR
ncbi:MAG TPA: PxKF domain-containing protein, partial [Candidatus Limnocylindrales bacterium]|nr:PxKF domain-containing protein [Candidatus Limnocylindrales bacterium]